MMMEGFNKERNRKKNRRNKENKTGKYLFSELKQQQVFQQEEEPLHLQWVSLNRPPG